MSDHPVPDEDPRHVSDAGGVQVDRDRDPGLRVDPEDPGDVEVREVGRDHQEPAEEGPHHHACSEERCHRYAERGDHGDGY